MSASSDAGRVGVWGASGSGKSSYVKQKIKGLPRLIVFDPLDEYRSHTKTRCTTIGAVQKAMRSNWRGFSICYVPPVDCEPQALNRLSDLLMYGQQPFKQGKSKLQMTLVVEEMNLSFPLHGGTGKAPKFAHICSRGRHFGINVFGLSQRIAEVHTRFRGNCTETVALRQKGRADVEAAANEIGVDKGVIRALTNLEYIHEANGIKTPGQISFSKATKRRKVT